MKGRKTLMPWSNYRDTRREPLAQPILRADKSATPLPAPSITGGENQNRSGQG